MASSSVQRLISKKFIQPSFSSPPPVQRLISKKFIEPSFSSPPPLRSYKLGLIDQLINNLYIPISFFYPNKPNNFSSQGNIPSLLENSFSKVLSSYYPLAGRTVDNLNIDCNEMGATLIEAHVNCKMSQISRNPNISAQDVLFPTGLPWNYEQDQRLLVAQLTHFECGGKALSLAMSHKVGDAQTLASFARDWAVITKEAGGQKSSPTPQLNVASILPPIEDPLTKPEFGMFPQYEDSVTKRFVFDSSKLSELKAKVSAETGITNPTRVEVVTALIHKCSSTAALLVDPKSYKLPICIQVVNMRPLINPPLSPNSVGNITNYFGVPFPNEKNLTFPKLVRELRKSKEEFYEKFKGMTSAKLRQEILNSVEFMKTISAGESNMDQYICSSICRNGLYDLDFGWGTPERVSIAASKFRNFTVLMDDPNGGLEAFVPLGEKVMDAFERDPELLKFSRLG